MVLKGLYSNKWMLIEGYEIGVIRLIIKKMQQIVKKELNFKIDTVQTMNEICL